MTSEAALTSSAAREIAPHLFPERTPMTGAQIEAGINVCLGIQRRATSFGKRPFAACLLAPDNETVLLMHQSVDQVNHAETTLYWAHIGRVVYAASNEQLAELTGPGNKENFTMKWHTRDILLDQQKDIEVIGPVETMDKIVMEESDQYWKTTR
ncbi:hypothetical protein D0Z07_1187 [Hyphodiscus hymeniophilus]|uniref:Uncharacterized protein n=1 Tax=Hyphodiscus hymeniophilus TaxID=353542 RepID=A0A9P6VQJ8_9HELO|nr:hypothetical protein D0Z07_1187 [Hyphodiscus hymeniophilus]